jgi:hypothetical protein
VVQVEVGKRVVAILHCLPAGQGVSKKLLMSVVVTLVRRKKCSACSVWTANTSRVCQQLMLHNLFFKRYNMRYTPFWTRRRSLHGSWRRVEGAAECKDSDQHEVRTLTKADNNSKNGNDQDDVVRADAGGRRRTSKRLSGRYGIVGRSSWAERKGPVDVCFLLR